jgi:hypothetical protein
VQYQVLGRIIVGELERLLDGIRGHGQTLADGLSQDTYAGQGTCLGVDLVLDFFKEPRRKIDADEHDLRVNAMLRLREKVDCYKDCVCGFVCDYLGEMGQCRNNNSGPV